MKKLNNSMRVPVELSSISSEFKQKLDSNYSKKLRGIVKSLILRNNTVFAIVERDHNNYIQSGTNEENYNYVEGGIGLFNSVPNTTNISIAELAIPTDISPTNNSLNRYIGCPAVVTVINDVAVFASVLQASVSLTTIPPDILRAIRLQVSPTADIFNYSKYYKIWKSYGITEEEVNDLKSLSYDHDIYEQKIISFEGEGSWIKDTQNPLSNEVVLKTNNSILDLNNTEMKTDTFHLPIKLFSSK